jgi:hypothetical protein
MTLRPYYRNKSSMIPNVQIVESKVEKTFRNRNLFVRVFRKSFPEFFPGQIFLQHGTVYFYWIAAKYRKTKGIHELKYWNISIMKNLFFIGKTLKLINNLICS